MRIKGYSAQTGKEAGGSAPSDFDICIFGPVLVLGPHIKKAVLFTLNQ
jgi:hypothetical protein